MDYPTAYCLSCRKHTETKNRHTVVLVNSARALTGYCPDCKNQVYKILAKKKSQQTCNGKASLGKKPRNMSLSGDLSNYTTSFYPRGVKSLATCPCCHENKMSFFRRAIRNPLGVPVLLGECLTCRSVVRKTVPFIPDVLQNPRTGLRLSSYMGRFTGVIGLLFLLAYYYKVGV